MSLASSFVRGMFDGLVMIGALYVRIAVLLVENLNGLLFVSGLVSVYVGVAAWSVAAARVVLGLVLMAIATWPYLVASSKQKGER